MGLGAGAPAASAPSSGGGGPTSLPEPFSSRHTSANSKPSTLDSTSNLRA